MNYSYNRDGTNMNDDTTQIGGNRTEVVTNNE